MNDDFEEMLNEDEDGVPDSKRKKAKAKFDRFMADVAEDLVPEEILSKIEKKLYWAMKQNNIPPTVANINALIVGFEFGVASRDVLGAKSQIMIMGLKLVLKKKRTPDIDITKSKPLPEKE